MYYLTVYITYFLVPYTRQSEFSNFEASLLDSPHRYMTFVSLYKTSTECPQTKTNFGADFTAAHDSNSRRDVNGLFSSDFEDRYCRLSWALFSRVFSMHFGWGRCHWPTSKRDSARCIFGLHFAINIDLLGRWALKKIASDLFILGAVNYRVR